MKKILCFMCLLIIPIKIFATEIDKDNQSGIILSVDENTLPNDTILRVNSINNQNIVNVSKNFGFSNYNAYTISILNNENAVLGVNNIKLSFPILDMYKVNENNPIYIIKVNNNGIIETTYTNSSLNDAIYKRYDINDNYVTIKTNAFATESEVTYLIGTQNNLEINSNIENPKTIDNNSFTLILISTFVLIGIMILFIKLYIDNKEKI